jgi:periplasmic protein TonB
MKTQHVESLEEIIFENRNKEYGAFSLRKNYGSHILISLSVAVLFMGTALTYPLIMRPNEKSTEKTDSVFVISNPFSPSLPDQVLPPPPPESVRDKPDNILSLKPPIVTDAPINNEFGKQILLADNKLLPLLPFPESGIGQPVKNEPVISQPVKSEPATWVEEMPHFPGGEAELHTFLLTRIKYPFEAREINLQGIVYLSFVVENDGSITNITVLKAIGSGCEEEALRVIRSMPNWIPGKQNGLPVRVKLTLPIKFTLQ